MAKQLWQKGTPLDDMIHGFTVGNDPQTDLELLPWDIYGTAAHVRMLGKCGLMASQDSERLLAELAVIMAKYENGSMGISREQEDCHTAIEQALTAALGDAGRNVHLGRSRNDQVLTALRLYMRASALELGRLCCGLAGEFAGFAQKHQFVLMPGYTHLRRAMPSSAGIWGISFAEALVEELGALEAVLERLDSCPLGSGAGFGVPLPLDREYAAELLGFSRLQRSVADCANSRGRHELALAGWISGVGNVLEKFFWDLALYSTEEFGFISLPDEYTTGSSIMPQKRNPDVVELCRARCAQLRAWRNEIEQVSTGLPSNYHRDYQTQKEPLLRIVSGFAELLQICRVLLPKLVLNAERCSAACTPELYAAQEAYRRVLEGQLQFRDAYAVVGREVLDGSYRLGSTAPAGEHTGSAGRLYLPQLQAEIAEAEGRLTQRATAVSLALSTLLPSH